VLVSSHLLREVEATVDRLVVIDHGRVVAQGTMADLVAQSGPGAVVVRGTDPHALRAALAAAGLPADRQEDGSLLVRADVEQVGRAALEGRQVLLELRRSGDGLEDLFFRLTSSASTPGSHTLEEVPA
jgi:ABC-2 type transport system ATP-binding protein